MTNAHGVARDQLRAFVERIERLEEEKKTIADDIKDVYGEAKSMGFDTKVLKKLIGLRKKDEQERQEEELILDTYMAALGMIPQMDMFEDDAPKAKSPAMALQSPRKAAEAVSERTATNQPETAHETMGGTGDDCSFGNRGVWPPQGGASSSHGNDSHRVVTAGETATEIHANPEEVGAHGETVSVPFVDAGSRPVVGRSTTATSEVMDVTGGESAATSPKVLDGRSPVAGESRHHCDVSEDEAGQNLTGNPIPEIDPSEDRSEGQSLDAVRADANTGGDHVDPDHSHAATAGTRINHIVPATKPKTARDFRPNCLKPDACGASGLSHCYSCTKAMQKAEEFA